MDRFALADSLRAANARVMAGQWALLEQRMQIHELEQRGLDASPAKALLQIYEHSQAMSISDRNRLFRALTSLAAAEPSSVDHDDRDFFESNDDIYHREAA